MLKSLLTVVLLLTVQAARAAAPLDCPAAVAEALLEVMPEMGATAYAPQRYGFMRSTCGSAENGPYCLGRDFHDVRQDPVYRQDAEIYAKGLRDCGVPRDGQGRLQTGEIRCRPDAGATCRIFPPSPAPANWPARSPVRTQEPAENNTEDIDVDEDEVEVEDEVDDEDDEAVEEDEAAEEDEEEEDERPPRRSGRSWRERAGGVWNSMVTGAGNVARGTQRRWNDWRSRRRDQAEREEEDEVEVEEEDEDEAEAEESEEGDEQEDSDFEAPDDREGYSDRPRN